MGLSLYRQTPALSSGGYIVRINDLAERLRHLFLCPKSHARRILDFMQMLYLTLEYLYYLSGIAIAVIAGFGLRQLTIAKDIARVTAQRDAFKLAADRCQHYFEHIIPLINTFNDAIRENNVVFFDKGEVEIIGEELKINTMPSESDFSSLLSLISASLPVYNALEGFAVFFISGVADESVAFSTVGATYCHTVKKYLLDLAFCYNRGYCQNVIKLYIIWSNRLESMKLQIKKKHLDSELSKIKLGSIKPLGTD